VRALHGPRGRAEHRPILRYRTAGGRGIGLTLVRELVERHGGEVAVTSKGPGEGSDFVVQLPTTTPVEAPKPRPSAPPPVTPRRILVVDDNQDSLDMMAMLLGTDGHLIETAADGLKAVEVARAFRPEVMFLDLGLPGRDGYEVARILLGEFPKRTLRLVALSGYGREADRRRTDEAGFDEHLVKPADPEVLARVLNTGSDRPCPA
jgi:CheY-like chemotaxis protein